MKTALYRHFAAGGDLLYVGITHDPQKRWNQHRMSSKWSLKVDKSTVEYFETRSAALAAEAIAIAMERPKFNVQLNAHKRLEHADRQKSEKVSRAKYFVWQPWARNEVAVQGDRLSPVIWQNSQWAVTEYGVECRDGTYAIEASRLWEGIDGGYGWGRHMREKEWVDLAAFELSMTVGRIIHQPRGKR